MSATPYGFRVLGARSARRAVVVHAEAFGGHARCDPRAELHREAYLSAFTFDLDFRRFFEETGSERGFGGSCGATWLWWDVDRADDLNRALEDARRLCGTLLDRYRELDDDDLLVFFSGAKGAHVGMPTVWQPAPSPDFHLRAKAFCLGRASEAGVGADASIYTKTRLFRAPNSRHPKSGLYKRRLSIEELTHLAPEAIVKLARAPEPFEIPTATARCPRAEADWVGTSGCVTKPPREGNIDTKGARLNALTTEFIREGACEGERAVRLFSAAANLAEFGCPIELARALLEEPALDSGLTPREARRQIESGLAHGAGSRQGGAG